MTTKPYFSGSNYLKKQGFKIDTEGAVLFDTLFWHFVDKHQEWLRKKKRPTWSGPHSILKMVLKA